MAKGRQKRCSPGCRPKRKQGRVSAKQRAARAAFKKAAKSCTFPGPKAGTPKQRRARFNKCIAGKLGG